LGWGTPEGPANPHHSVILLMPNFICSNSQPFLQQQAGSSFTYYCFSFKTGLAHLMQTPLSGRQQGARGRTRDACRGREEAPCAGCEASRAGGRNRRLQSAGCAWRRWVAFALCRKIFVFKTRARGDLPFHLIGTEPPAARRHSGSPGTGFGCAGLCFTSSPAGLTLLKHLAPLSLLFPPTLNTQIRKVLIARTGQTHLIVHKCTFSFFFFVKKTPKPHSPAKVTPL